MTPSAKLILPLLLAAAGTLAAQELNVSFEAEGRRVDGVIAHTRERLDYAWHKMRYHSGKAWNSSKKTAETAVAGAKDRSGELLRKVPVRKK